MAYEPSSYVGPCRCSLCGKTLDVYDDKAIFWFPDARVWQFFCWNCAQRVRKTIKGLKNG